MASAPVASGARPFKAHATSQLGSDPKPDFHATIVTGLLTKDIVQGNLLLDNLSALRTFALQGNRTFAGAGPQYATLFRASKFPRNTQELERRLNTFRKDDVWSEDFLGTVILIIHPDHRFQADQLPLGHESLRSSTVQRVQCEGEFDEGPCIILDGKLYTAWRARKDSQHAFSHAVQPSRNSGQLPYERFRHYSGSHDLIIATPSRIPWLTAAARSTARTLAGLRITVKDNIDLKGVKTGLGAKAIKQSAAPADETASAISNLTACGALVVGKTKLSPFAAPDDSMGQVDEPPWNPRADGYLHAGASSSGAAAATATYGWIDGSVATDTAGSIRDPAARNGVFGIRTTYGYIPKDHVHPMASTFDTVGFMARDIDVLTAIVQAAAGHDRPAQQLVLDRIIPLKFAPELPDEPRVLYETFVEDFTRYVKDRHGAGGGASSHADLYSATDRLRDQDQMERMSHAAHTVATIKHHEHAANLNLIRDRHRDRYDEDFFISPANRESLHCDEKITCAMYEDALCKKEEYASISRRLLTNGQPGKIESVLGNLIVFPRLANHPQRPQYRTKLSSRQSQSQYSPFERWTTGLTEWLRYMLLNRGSWSPNSIATLSGCPEIVIPIGQISFQGRVSNRPEKLPMTVSIIGPPNSDVALLRLLFDFLQQYNRPTTVQTGRNAFPIDSEEPVTTHSHSSHSETANILSLYMNTIWPYLLDILRILFYCLLPSLAFPRMAFFTPDLTTDMGNRTSFPSSHYPTARGSLDPHH